MEESRIQNEHVLPCENNKTLEKKKKLNKNLELISEKSSKEGISI